MDMNIVCLDLEGVLVPEIWIAFAEASGIPELKRTTRDEPDCDDNSFIQPRPFNNSFTVQNTCGCENKSE